MSSKEGAGVACAISPFESMIKQSPVLLLQLLISLLSEGCSDYSSAGRGWEGM